MDKITAATVAEQLVAFGFIPTAPGQEIDVGSIPVEQVAARLRSYQAFHGIPSSGTVCPATLRSFGAWRFCKHPHFMAESLDLAKWPQGAGQTVDLPWTMTNQWIKISQDMAKAAIEQAFSYWESCCNVKARYVESAADAVILIEQQAIDQPGGVLAWSELPDGVSRTPRHQRYDSQETWVVDERPSGLSIDLVRVAAHELGHAIGIPHISSGNLMAPIYSTSIRGPQQGDIAEAQSRYGKPVVVPPPAPPPAPTPEDFTIQIAGAGKLAAVSITGFRVTRLAP